MKCTDFYCQLPNVGLHEFTACQAQVYGSAVDHVVLIT